MIDEEGMHADIDFDPILSEVVVDSPRGILGRRDRRVERNAADVHLGRERIRVVNGKILESLEAPGASYWTRSKCLYVDVDTSEHDIVYEEFLEESAQVEFEVKFDVVCRVLSARQVVLLNLHSVRSRIRAVLHKAIQEAFDEALSSDASVGGDPLSRMDGMFAALRHLVAANFASGTRFKSSDNILEVRVVTAKVALSASSADHRRALRSVVRKAEIATSELTHRKVVADAEIELRRVWSTYLGDRLDSEMGRSVELLAADPSPENLQVVIAKMNERDSEVRGAVLSFLGHVIDKDLLGNADELRSTFISLTASSRLVDLQAPKDSLTSGEASDTPEIRSSNNADVVVPPVDDASIFDRKSG